MTKGELREQRQAAHATVQAERLAAGDTRTAQQRHNDRLTATAPQQKRRRTSTRVRRTPLEQWAVDYYETEGAIDQFNPEDR